MAKKKRDLWELPERPLAAQAALIAKAATSRMARDATPHEVFKRAVACRALANATLDNLKGKRLTGEHQGRALWVAYALGFEWRSLVTAVASNKFATAGARGGKAEPRSKVEKRKAKLRARLREDMNKFLTDPKHRRRTDHMLDRLIEDYGPNSSVEFPVTRGTMKNMLSEEREKLRAAK